MVALPAYLCAVCVLDDLSGILKDMMAVWLPQMCHIYFRSLF